MLLCNFTKASSLSLRRLYFSVCYRCLAWLTSSPWWPKALHDDRGGDIKCCLLPRPLSRMSPVGTHINGQWAGVYIHASIRETVCVSLSDCHELKSHFLCRQLYLGLHPALSSLPGWGGLSFWLDFDRLWRSLSGLCRLGAGCQGQHLPCPQCHRTGWGSWHRDMLSYQKITGAHHLPSVISSSCIHHHGNRILLVGVTTCLWPLSPFYLTSDHTLTTHIPTQFPPNWKAFFGHVIQL